MKFDDVELMVEVLLVAAMVCFFLALATFVAALVFLFRLRERLRRLGAPLARDLDGRRIKERF
jgi:Flp pilus assembly protein TadB